MHLGLNWLTQSLALVLTLNGLINYTSASLNIFDGERFENCVRTILSKYPFISSKDLRKFSKILHESNYLLRENPSAVEDGKDTRHQQKKLSDLLTVDDQWRDSRDEAYITAIERCSLLVSRNPESDLLKDLVSFKRYKRHLGSSKHKKRRHPKPTSRSGKVRQKRDVASSAFAPSSASGQGGIRTGNAIENVIRDTLTTSNTFTKVFHAGVQQNDAKVIAQDITKAGLYGYSTAVIKDAVDAVTRALSFTTLDTNSDNYGLLMARSITEVLKRYDLMSQANGSQITNNMIREIQILLGDTPQDQPPLKKSSPSTENLKDSAVVQTNVNNQFQMFPPIQPSPVVMTHQEDRVAMFRNKLTSFLADSRELSNLYCQGSSPNVFQTVKTALSNYGLKISINAAVRATNAFMTLDSEQSCSQYANILSEVIRDVLFDNGLLESVKPEDIALKIASSAKAFSNPSPSVQSETQKENFKSPLPLLPSFPEAPLAPNNEKEFYEGSGGIRKGFLNPPTPIPALYEVKMLNTMPAIQTPPLQATSFQSEHSNQRVVEAREKDQNPMPAIQTPPLQATSFRSEPSNQRVVEAREKDQNPMPEIETQPFQATSFWSEPFVKQSDYSTTPSVTLGYSHSQKLPNMSTDWYEATQTSTMAPQIVTKDEYVPDYTQASEFINVFMRAFEMFTSAPHPDSKDLSGVDVDDSKKISALLEKEMESYVQVLSQSGASEGKEGDSKTMTSSKSNADRKQTNTEKPSETRQSEARHSSTKNASVSVKVAATSSQSRSVVRNPTAKPESSFTPTPATTFKEETQQEEVRKSEIMKKVYSISTSGITFIRSPNFTLQELCSTLNGFAEVVGIEPVPFGNCAELPLIDYLLHVLREVSSTKEKD